MICNVDKVTKWSLQTKAFSDSTRPGCKQRVKSNFFYGAFVLLAFFPNKRRPSIKKNLVSFLVGLTKKQRKKTHISIMRVCFSTAPSVENHFLPSVCNFVPQHHVGREVQTSYRSQISCPIICKHTSLPYFPFHTLLEMTDKRTGALPD